jgi:Yip1 domain
MSTTLPPATRSGTRSFAGRVKGILLQPGTEWEKIAAEQATAGSIYRYVLILAVIPPAGSAIGLWMTGDFHTNGVWLVQIAIGSYARMLICVYLVARIIDALAPAFGGQKGRIAALKVAAYSATAVWVAGILFVNPSLGWLAGVAAAMYSIYLLYRGLPVVMKSPLSQAVPYTVMTVAAVIVVSVAVGTVLGQPLEMVSALLFHHGHRHP